MTACEALALEVLVLAEDANLSADGLGGVLIVSGDDHDADTCLSALLDALGHLWTRWIKHTNQTKKRHALFKLLVLLSGLGFAREVGVDVVDARERHDTQSPVAVLGHFILEERSKFTGKLLALAVAADETVSAARENGFGSTFDEKSLGIAIANQNRHALSIT